MNIGNKAGAATFASLGALPSARDDPPVTTGFVPFPLRVSRPLMSPLLGLVITYLQGEDAVYDRSVPGKIEGSFLSSAPHFSGVLLRAFSVPRRAFQSRAEHWLLHLG